MATIVGAGGNNAEAQIPEKSLPTPPEETDEESFVVLCRSLTDEIDFSCNFEAESLPNGAVEEASRIISEELAQISEMQAFPANMDNNSISEKVSLNGISIKTYSSDLPPEEIQAKVESLIEENINLKSTIMQNNIGMKAQYDRIVEWQSDVEKTYETHKAKFAEAKNIIAKLKTENNILKQELDKYKNDVQTLEIKLNDELLKNEQNPQTKAEIMNLKIDLEKSNEINQLYVKEILSLKADLLKLQAEQVNSGRSRSFDAESEKKIAELEEKLSVITLQNSQYCDEKTSIGDFEEKVVNLQKELDAKDCALEELKLKLEESKRQSIETEKNLNHEIINLKSQIYLNPPENVKEQLATVRQQLMGSQALITELEQKNKDLNNILAENKTKIEETEQKLKSMDEQKNEFFALESQLEVYKNDFEAERQAKETIKSEKDQISDDVLHLQRRNQQLQEEIEILRDRGFELVRNPNASMATAPESSPLAARYECPICNKKFRSMRFVTEHVETCLGASSESNFAE